MINRSNFVDIDKLRKFFIDALISAALGFGGIAGAATGIAKILFFVFVVLFVISMLMQALRGRPPRL